MGNPAEVKRDFVALEQQRLQGAQLLSKGLSEAEVARQVGVHRQSVNRWHRQLQTEGRASFKRTKRAGRKPQLTPAELRRLGQLLKRGPDAFGFATNLWTLPREPESLRRSGASTITRGMCGGCSARLGGVADGQ